jgi:hypothetical protein
MGDETLRTGAPTIEAPRGMILTVAAAAELTRRAAGRAKSFMIMEDAGRV